MATKAQIALATATSFLDDVRDQIRKIDDADDAQALRPSILNTISLASRKIAEAEQLDPAATYDVAEDKVFDIPIFKSLALDAEGFIHSLAGDHKKALGVLEQAIRLYPDNSMAWFHKGLVHAGSMQKQEAITAIAKAVELDEENIEYHKALEEVRSISGSEIAAAKVMSAGRKTFGVMRVIFISFCLLPFIAIIGGLMTGDGGAVASGVGMLFVFGLFAMAYDKVKSFFS